MSKSIAVYCSASSAVPDVYGEVAKDVGRLIGESGYELVWGGSIKGLMGMVADSTKASNGKVYGVIPSIIEDVKYTQADELIVSKDLAERKRLMEERADAFIVLPGGFGTLDEVMEVLLLKQLGFHDKAIIFVNSSHYYEHLLLQFDRMFTDNTAKAEYRALYYVASTVEEAFDYIKNYVSSNLTKKWFDSNQEMKG